MKRQIVFTFALLFPITMVAQNLNEHTGETLAVNTVEAMPPATLSSTTDLSNHSSSSFPQGQTQASTKAADKTTKYAKRPKSEGSMVGYIDNAIIASQIRIRFDAAFDDPLPDRAEFFYAKCGCYQLLNGIITPAYDPTAPGPGPGVPTTLNYQQLYILGEYAPIRRFSAFFEVPFRWLQPQGFKTIPPFAPFGNEGGISDVRFGVKLGIYAGERSSVTFQFGSSVASGDASKGLGTNHATIEPALLFRKQVTPRFSLEAQVGDSHPIGGSQGVPTASSSSFAGDVFFYGIGPSYEVYRSHNFRLAPVIELVGWHVLGGFQTDPGGLVNGAATDVSGLNIVNLKFGARAMFGNHSSVYAGYGRALTNAVWYQDIVRLEYRYSF